MESGTVCMYAEVGSSGAMARLLGGPFAHQARADVIAKFSTCTYIHGASGKKKSCAYILYDGYPAVN